MQGYVLTPWTTVQSSLSSFTQDEEEWIDLSDYGDCAFWIEVAELTPPAGSTVKLALETAPLPDESLFQPVVPDITLVAATAPTIVKSVRTPTTAPLSRFLRWKLKGSGGSWSESARSPENHSSLRPRTSKAASSGCAEISASRSTARTSARGPISPATPTMLRRAIRPRSHPSRRTR
jgi:hypothetical protein